jgi:membrane associated rhomboid family serine protease
MGSGASSRARRPSRWIDSITEVKMAYGTRGFGFGYALTPMVKRLLIANGVVFFASLVIGGDVFVEWLAFHPDRLLTRPWGVLTYMFVHADFMHIAVNMLVLFFFGPPLEAAWGSREFLKFYVICGVGGVALSLLLQPAVVVGASGALFGVMLAFAMNWPEAPIYVWGIFPVKAKWLVAFLFVMTVFAAFGGPGGAVAHFAHLGGLVAGFVYLKMDWRTSERLSRLKKATRVRRLAIVPRDDQDEGERTAAAGGWSQADERRLLDAVDQVLDKISAEGMASLTSDERRILDEVSRRHRTD